MKKSISGGGKQEESTDLDNDCTCELKGGIVHTVSCALWDKTVEKVMKESTGGDWEEEFEKWGTEIKISNEPRKTKVYVVDGLKEFIASELTKTRDEAYKEGARTQAEMDAKLVSEARHRGQLDLVRAISKIADECTDEDLLTADYDEFADRVLELVEKLKEIVG